MSEWCQENRLTGHVIHVRRFKKIKKNIILNYVKNGREITGKSPVHLHLPLDKIKIIKKLTFLFYEQ